MESLVGDDGCVEAEVVSSGEKKTTEQKKNLFER